MVKPKSLKSLDRVSTTKPKVVDKVMNVVDLDLYKKSYTSKMFVQAGPLSRPRKDDLVFSVERGPFVFQIVADPRLGLPWGTYYRLIQIWIDTQIILGNVESVKHGYKLVLGPSLRKWLKKIGLDPNGRTMNAITDQWLRFTSSKYAFETSKDASKYGVHGRFEGWITIAVESVLCWLKEDNQKDHIADGNTTNVFESYVVLNAKYVDFVNTQRGIPLDDRILCLLKGSPLGIDFYRWLTYRAATGKSFEVKVNDLLKEFGITSEFFRRKQDLENYLNRIKTVWTDLNAYFTSGDRGTPAKFVMKKSAPSVPRKLKGGTTLDQAPKTP